MNFPKLALAVGIAILTAFPLAAQKWAQLEGGKGYTSGAETILAKVTPQPAARVVKTARSFEGLPYVWAGKSPTKGFDCSGFVHEVLRLNGYSVPRMADDQFYKSSRVSRDALRPGDMVFFETYMPGPSHVGLYLGQDEFIHASSGGRGVTISSLKTRYYADRFLGGGRPSGWQQEGRQRRSASRAPKESVTAIGKTPAVTAKSALERASSSPPRTRTAAQRSAPQSTPTLASRPFANPPQPTLVPLPKTGGSPWASRTSTVAAPTGPAPRPTAVPR